MLEWATAQRLPDRPVIVDLCTGSGALAVALARHRPAARIVGIDDSEAALDYARRNAEGTAVELVRADVTTPGLLPELDGRVDLVVANPPYIPDGAVLEPEVAHHDPPHALFGGPNGMAVIEAVVGLAGRWLRPGGLFAVEHDDTTSSSTVELVSSTDRFEDIQARNDLAGRPRFVTARRAECGPYVREMP
jgi:release factor glutamine methyltransferase